MDESWHDRITTRARQRWEREGRPDGRDREIWLNAERELWQEALGSATALAERLNRMRRSLDEGAEEGLQAAAEIGCEAMSYLIEETSFASELQARQGRSPLLIWSPEADKYLDDLELFEDFLTVERQLLLRSGLDPVLADQITSLLKGQSQQLRGGNAGSAAVLLLKIAAFRACQARDAIRDRLQPPPSYAARPVGWYRRSERGIWWAIGGGLVFVANLAVSAAVPEVFSEVSKEAGSFIFGHGMSRLAT